jgi:hypothetical protein
MPTFISTSGHGYLKVTLKQALEAMYRGAVFTDYSFMSFSHALLEEDIDAGTYIRFMGDENIKDKYQDDIRRDRLFRMSLGKFTWNMESFIRFTDKCKKFQHAFGFAAVSVRIGSLNKTYYVYGKRKGSPLIYAGKTQEFTQNYGILLPSDINAIKMF